MIMICILFFFSSRRRHTRFDCDWSSDVCSSDLHVPPASKIWRNRPRMSHLLRRFGEIVHACPTCFEDLAKSSTHVPLASKIWRNRPRMSHLLRRFGEIVHAWPTCFEDLAKS